MDDNTKKELKMATITIMISAAAAIMGIIAFGIAASHGKISWVGIVVAGAMIINIIPAFKRRRQIVNESKKKNQR